MSKITLDHLELSREIALMIQQGNIKQASKHYDQRREKTEQALAFLDSPEIREACSDCLLQAAINALVHLTLPENADNEDRKAQNYLVAAYVIQQATARHTQNKASHQTIDGERLH